MRFRVIIWLNGPFGVGKTATALELANTMFNARLFDAETVGYLLMATLRDQEFSDFQDLPRGAPWSPSSRERSRGSLDSICSLHSPY
jgi:hypothetical protein